MAGFELVADLAEWPGPDGDTTLRVIATSVTGERLELEPTPVTVGPKRLSTHPSNPVSRSERLEGPPILVFTHQLDLGGAQLYLRELLSELVKHRSADPVVVSAIDGAVRGELEEPGIPVYISGAVPVDDSRAYARRVQELAAWAEGGGFKAALINTATGLSLPGASVAAELGIPAIWTIHESVAPSLLWSYMDPDVRHRGEEALSEAASLVFQAEGTQRLYESATSPDRCVRLNGGVDLPPIDAERDGFDRAAARLEAGIPADADLVLCVGTVEPRKAQIPLAQAFNLIADRHPRARLAIVGCRNDPYSTLLGSHCDRERIDLVPVSPDVQRWYGMADIYVCASDIESLPRTVIEAMAWEKPTLATSIFGLTELIEDGKTGWLVEPRDVAALAAGLDRALSSGAQERATMGRAARALVEQRHTAEDHALAFARLLDEVIANRAGASRPMSADR
jgi:D-inositol-3-phosphate glycosyltransferase